jgi:hypothetical protein
VAAATFFFDLKIRIAVGRNLFSESENAVMQQNSFIAICYI